MGGAAVTFVRVKVAAQRGFVSEGGGDERGQHGEVCGAVGTSRQRVEGVVPRSPHGALVRHQVWGGVLISEHARAKRQRHLVALETDCSSSTSHRTLETRPNETML